ncbi:FtsX-like permease family protein [Aeromicrobium sp. P5_D10]
MMLAHLSRHSVRRNWSPYIGSVVALFFGATLIGLAVELIAAVASYQSRVRPGDTETLTQLEDLSSMLGVMSTFSGFIAIFVVASTFSFVVSSRRRELGLLRLIGATPRQIRRMIRGESIIVAAVASLAGGLLAHLTAPFALWLAHERGAAPVRLDAPSLWLNLAITLPLGTVVALLGARAAARRAARISPVDAMREAVVERSRPGLWRLATGTLFLAGSIAMLIGMGAISGELALVLGIFVPEMLVIAAVCFGPLLFPWLAKLIAWPLMRTGQVSIRIARDNVAASAKRTASLAAPTLAISAIAGSLLLTLGIAADYDRALNTERLKAPVVVQGDDRVGELLERSPDIRIADSSAAFSFTLVDQYGDRETAEAEAIDVDAAIAARGLRAHKGSLDDLHGRTIAMSRGYAFDAGFHLGEKMTVTFEDREPMKLRIVAIVDDAPSLYGGLLVPKQLVPAPADRWFVIPQKGLDEPTAAVSAALAGTSAQVDSAQSWIDATDAEMRRNNTLSMWVVLGPGGFYAALAIANTLLMASLQRRPEFVATRLIGATERQVRQIVLCEAALVTLASLALGAAITATVGVLIRSSLRDGLDRMPVHVPWAGLGAIGGTCLVIATVAAVVPTAFMLRRVHPSQATG